MNDREQRKPGGAARNAFTIVEVFFVMVIIGILSAIAVPRYAGFVANQQLEGAARRLTADLSLAQRQARRSSASQTVVFDVANSKYQLVGMKHPDHASQPFEVCLKDEPYRARIVSASFGGDATLVFNGFGAPDTAGTVVIAVGAYQKTINVVLETGRAH